MLLDLKGFEEDNPRGRSDTYRFGEWNLENELTILCLEKVRFDHLCPCLERFEDPFKRTGASLVEGARFWYVYEWKEPLALFLPRMEMVRVVACTPRHSGRIGWKLDL